MLIELSLVSILFLAGYGALRFFLGQRRLLLRLALAFPIGCCFWGGAVWLSALCPGCWTDAYGLNLAVAGACFAAGVLFLWCASVARERLSLQEGLSLGIMVACMDGLYFAFTWWNASVLTADSLSQSHPQMGYCAFQSVRAFNQAFAALIGVFQQDRYPFAFHALFGVSLHMLVYDAVYTRIRQRSAGNALLARGYALAGVLLLGSCHMTAIQMFYVNNHMLFATLLIGSMLLLDAYVRENAPRMGTPGIILLAFLGMLRPEGQLVAVVFVVIGLGRSGLLPGDRLKLVFLFSLLTMPFLIFLLYLDETKVQSSHLAVILAGTVLLPFLYWPIRHKLIRHMQDRSGAYLLVCLIVAFAVSVVLRPALMQRRISMVFVNLFDLSYWGFTNHLVVLLTLLLPVAIVGGRFFGYSRKTPGDGQYMLMLWVAGVLSVVCLLNFTNSRYGWSGSHNRMMFHFLPIWIAWLCSEWGMRHGES